jgi:peptidoglycan hydrolase CwlO-like protein
MKKKAPKKILTPKALAKRVVSDLPKHTNEDVKRYVGAVSEHFGHQVSAVAEQIVGVHEKLDSHTEAIGSIKEDIEIMKANIEILKSGMRIKVDYQDFEALERRVRLIEAKSRR